LDDRIALKARVTDLRMALELVPGVIDQRGEGSLSRIL
jgi:hypothetical protein